MLNAIKIDTNVVDVIVSPPALYCEMVLSSLTPNVGVCAQNVSLTCCGAYTGEIAARQFAGTHEIAYNLKRMIYLKLTLY